jgi:membrane protein DedA with SNARE-associated domain
MESWSSIWAGLTGFVATHGLLAVAVIVALKSAGIPLPVPADLLVIFVGVQAASGLVPLWLAWLVLAASTTAGAALLYMGARWVRPENIVHYGHYVGLSEGRLRTAEDELRQRGRRAIFLARVIPGLRLAIVVVCGILGTPWRTFLSPVALAAVAYVGICLGIGYLLGPAVVDSLARLALPVGLAAQLVAVGLLLVWLVRTRRTLRPQAVRTKLPRSERVRAGALAGALAIAGATMVLNVVYFGGPLGGVPLAPPGLAGAAAQQFQSTLTLAYLLTTVVLVIALGVVWGATYGAVSTHFVADLPDWVRGLGFAVLPLLISVLSLAPLALVQPRTSMILLVFGEVFRWTNYGILLGLIFPIFGASGSRYALS